MIQTVLSIIILISLTYSFYMLGKACTDREQLSLNIVLGQSLLILLLIIAGLLRLLNSSLFLAINTFAFLFTVFKSGELLSALSLLTKIIRKKLKDRAFVLDVFIAFALLLPVFIECFFPMIGDQSHDTTRYHWSSVLQFLYARSFVFCPDIYHSNGPLNLELTDLPYLCFNLEYGARLNHFLWFLLLGHCIHSVGRSVLRARFNRLLVLLVWGTPLLSRFAANGYIDVGLALWCCTTLYLFKEMNSRPVKRVDTVIFGIVSGICLGIKYTSMFFLFPVFIWGIVYTWAIKGRITIRYIAGAVAIAFVCGCFWYLRNYINLGNPVFPAAYTFFQARNFPLGFIRDEYEFFAQRVWQFDKNIFTFLMFPWNFTFHSDKYQNWMSITPVYLACVPLVFYKIRDIVAKCGLELCVSALFFLFLFLNYPEARYFSPVIPFIALIVVFALQNTGRVLPQVLRNLLIVYIICNLLFSACLIADQTVKYMPHFMKTAYSPGLRRYPSFIEGYKLTNNISEKDSKICLIYGGGAGGGVHYYVRRRAYLFMEKWPEIFNVRKDHMADDFDKFLLKNGIRYILDMNPHRTSPLIPEHSRPLSPLDGEWVLYSVEKEL